MTLQTVGAVSAGANSTSHPAANRPAAHSDLAPAALLSHSTAETSKSGSRHANAQRLPAALPTASGTGEPLPLGDLPLGTYVTNQFEGDGILFSGQSPFITDDGSSSVNPTLSGSPLFQGTIVGTFVTPGTRTPTTVNAFSLDVGYIDDPDSVQMTVYGATGHQLGVLTATQEGFNQLYSTFAGAASFSVSTVSEEDAGWEMNTIQVGPINTTYAALGDSYTSGEGTDDFPWSTSQGTQCDTGPEAWPVLLADAEDQDGQGAGLDIGPSTLIACQSERTYQLDQAVNGEAESELDQLEDVSAQGTPRLVTLMIGGNDLGFADVLRDCFLGGTEVCLHFVDSLDSRVTDGSASLISTLEATYAEVRRHRR